MTRIGISGKVQAFTRYADAMPVLAWINDVLENAINGQLDATNIAVGGVATGSIANGAVTAVKLAPLSVTSAAIADGIGQVQSLQYTGDGLGARSIALTFQPRYVVILSHTDSITFEAIGSGTGPYAAFWRTSTGALTSGTTDFQGISGSAVLLGSAAANLSNKATQTYSLVSFR